MAAVLQVSSSLYTSISDVCVVSSSVPKSLQISRIIKPIGTSFSTGSPLLIQGSTRQRSISRKVTTISIRSEQGTKGGGVDVLLGRLAMVGFAVAISVEISTGKGLLQNFGLSSPLPTVVLVATAVGGILAAVFIFQSASDN